MIDSHIIGEVSFSKKYRPCPKCSGGCGNCKFTGIIAVEQ